MVTPSYEESLVGLQFDESDRIGIRRIVRIFRVRLGSVPGRAGADRQGDGAAHARGRRWGKGSAELESPCTGPTRTVPDMPGSGPPAGSPQNVVGLQRIRRAQSRPKARQEHPGGV